MLLNTVDLCQAITPTNAAMQEEVSFSIQIYITTVFQSCLQH